MNASLLFKYTAVFANRSHALRSLATTTVVSRVFPEAKHFVSKEHTQCEFSSAHPPVIRVDPGELMHVETRDCFDGRIQPGKLRSWETKHASRNQRNSNGSSKPQQQNNESSGGTYVNGSILDDIPRAQTNPVTGPIYVNGAKQGDVLAVTLLDIRPKGVGVGCCGTWGGQLSFWMTKNSTALRFFDMSRCGNIVTMRDLESNNRQRPGSMPPRKRLGPISFPARPMLGVVGVAPSPLEGDPIGTIPAGKHGGNLDNPANGIGSTIYIPIHHPGGLLSIGDMHASQGDGEIAGAGVEIGGDVLLKCTILKHEDLYGCSYADDDDHHETKDASTTEGIPLKLEYPVTETPSHWITHGVVIEDIPKTTVIACQEAAKILIGQWGFSKEEAFIFLSVRGDLGICQACHPDKGTQIAKVSVPRLDNLCPRAFRALLSSSGQGDASRNENGHEIDTATNTAE
jgi:amidase